MTYDWQTTFAQAIHAFGDTPGAQLEQHIRDTFTNHPQAVTNAISKISDAHQAGRIRSPWGALKTEIDKQVAREALVDSRTTSRAAEQRAEQWIRNAGKHYPTWDETLDELRSRDGLKDAWTPALQQRLAKLYADVRPEGERIDEQAEQRGREWIQQHAELKAHTSVTGEGGPPVCSSCGQEQGHSDDCAVAQRINDIRQRETQAAA